MDLRGDLEGLVELGGVFELLLLLEQVFKARYLRGGPATESRSTNLVPKLRLGMPSAKLCFACSE